MSRTSDAVIIAVLVVFTACSSSSARSAGSEGPTAGAVSTTASSSGPDPLVGNWRSDPVTKVRLEALVKSRFPEAHAPAYQRNLRSQYRQMVGVTTVHFGGGQLLVFQAGRNQWTGTYEVVDANTFVAGDPTNGLYITFRYRIDGGRLFVHVVKDLFPDDVGPNPAAVPDLLPQVMIWEAAPFTKAG